MSPPRQEGPSRSLIRRCGPFRNTWPALEQRARSLSLPRDRSARDSDAWNVLPRLRTRPVTDQAGSRALRGRNCSGAVAGSEPNVLLKVLGPSRRFVTSTPRTMRVDRLLRCCIAPSASERYHASFSDRLLVALRARWPRVFRPAARRRYTSGADSARVPVPRSSSVGAGATARRAGAHRGARFVDSTTVRAKAVHVGPSMTRRDAAN